MKQSRLNIKDAHPPTVTTIHITTNHLQMPDLLYELFVHPERKTLLEQMDRGNSMLPKGMDREVTWTTVMKTKNTIRTVDDAVFYVLVLLAGCPHYLHYVMERTNNKRALQTFMPQLRNAFNVFLQGRASNGSKAESTQQKKYISTVDLVADMRYLYCSL